MKNKLNFIIAIFALLTFSGMLMAQNNEDIEKQIEGKIARPQQQRILVQTDDITPSTESKEKKCPLGIQQVITAGINDNFQLPFEATYKSPAFLALFPSPPTNYKDFDDKAMDKVVGHSFMLNKIKPCDSKLCTGSLEMRVCNYGVNAWHNDHLYVGTIANNQLNATLFNAKIWQPNEANKCKIITVPITSVINPWTTLDVLVQDDTAVDYLKLTLNY